MYLHIYYQNYLHNNTHSTTTIKLSSQIFTKVYYYLIKVRIERKKFLNYRLK